jgi:FkbM family methyltransferase
MTSQHNIEQYIDKFFPEKGFFLEIGCWDGEHISQTAFLEREKGWQGICVDPFPRNFQNRSCCVCDRAISKDGQDREFIKVTIDRRYGGDVSYFSGFKDNIKAHWDLISEHCDYTTEVVKTITIDQLYESFNLPQYIEFLSVDTEGSELEIFRSIDFKKYEFGLIVFEHNRDQEAIKLIGNLLSENGYILYKALDIDDIYINKKLL